MPTEISETQTTLQTTSPSTTSVFPELRIVHEVKLSVKLSIEMHLWCFSLELVVLELFDDELSDWEKERLASQIWQMLRPDAYQPLKPVQPDFQPVSALLLPEHPALSGFVTVVADIPFTGYLHALYAVVFLVSILIITRMTPIHALMNISGICKSSTTPKSLL